MTAPDRIPCCVPFCKRTASRAKFPEAAEIICGKHYRLASPVLRQRLSKLRRRAARYSDIRKIKRAEILDAWLWERIKRQAIERAVGI